MDFNGQVLPPDQIPGIQGRLEFEGDRLTMFGPPPVIRRGTFQIETQKNPMHLIWKLDDGQVFHGIIDLQGKTLRFCLAEAAANGQPLDEVPADFELGVNRFGMTFTGPQPIHAPRK